MRILQLVDGDRWTGSAAVVFDQTAALIYAGVEAQFGFFGDSLLAKRLHPLGWARPILSKPRGPFSYFREVRRLRATLTREKFDVLHAHRSYDHTLGAFAVRGTNVRLVRTLHHVRHARPDPVTRAVFARTDAFAAANRAIAERFGRGVPILPPVVDVGRFHPGAPSEDLRRRFGLPVDKLLVGTVGKVSAGRGHAEAIDALAKLPANVALLHVGHGEHERFLRALSVRLGVFERNFWVGYQEDVLPDLYRFFDVFLFPASGSDQGQRAILEAMASGVPVVAIDVPGVRDLVTDGAEGYVVANADGFAGALAKLADEVALRHRFGEAGRTRAQAFTGARFAGTALPFYESVVAAR